MESRLWRQPPLVVVHVGIVAGVRSNFILFHPLSQAQGLSRGSFIAGIDHHKSSIEGGSLGKKAEQLMFVARSAFTEERT